MSHLQFNNRTCLRLLLFFALFTCSHTFRFTLPCSTRPIKFNSSFLLSSGSLSVKTQWRVLVNQGSLLQYKAQPPLILATATGCMPQHKEQKEFNKETLEPLQGFPSTLKFFAHKRAQIQSGWMYKGSRFVFDVDSLHFSQRAIV